MQDFLITSVPKKHRDILTVKYKQNGSDTSLKPWSEVEKELEPLSLVLFRGMDIVSSLIVQVESSVSIDRDLDTRYGTWSHVGVLVNRTIMPGVRNLKHNQWAVYEMTASGKWAGDATPDIETGNGKFGCQVRDFKSLLETYPGRLAILKLKNNPLTRRSGEKDEEYASRVAFVATRAELFRRAHRNTRYQLNVVRLFASVFPLLRWTRHFFPLSKRWQMCSDIVAAFYREIGILDPTIHPENALPQDFLGKDADREIPEMFSLPPIQVTPDDEHVEL